jgi:DNA-damage-inducible protein J
MHKITTIRARIEPDLKNDVDRILAELGLTTSETIQILYRQIKLRGGLPFEVVIPNKLTDKTLRASRSGHQVKHFSTKKELYSDLGL